jgi:hypothetical protein
MSVGENTAPPQTEEIFVGRLLIHNPEKKFYILSDGEKRFYAPERLFPSGLERDKLISFTAYPLRPGNKFPCIKKLVFEEQQ